MLLICVYLIGCFGVQYRCIIFKSSEAFSQPRRAIQNIKNELSRVSKHHRGKCHVACAVRDQSKITDTKIKGIYRTSERSG